MTDDQLAEYRRSIDKIDADLVRLLAERFRITHEIGVYKASNDLAPVDLVRQHRQIDGLRELASSEGLDPEFCEKFVHFVMDEVIQNHKRIARSNSKSGTKQAG